MSMQNLHLEIEGKYCITLIWPIVRITVQKCSSIRRNSFRFSSVVCSRVRRRKRTVFVLLSHTELEMLRLNQVAAHLGGQADFSVFLRKLFTTCS